MAFSFDNSEELIEEHDGPALAQGKDSKKHIETRELNAIRDRHRTERADRLRSRLGHGLRGRGDDLPARLREGGAGAVIFDFMKTRRQAATARRGGSAAVWGGIWIALLVPALALGALPARKTETPLPAGKDPKKYVTGQDINQLRDFAEALGAAVQQGSALHPTVEAGLAATEEGKLFSVVGDLSTEYATVMYRKESGQAVEVARHPTKSTVDALAATHAADKAAQAVRDAGQDTATTAMVNAEAATRIASVNSEASVRAAEDAAIRAQIASAALGGGVNIADNSTVLATGTTTSRALRDRWADVVNVKDFLPAGQPDGTTDNTAGVQAAIDRAAALGGTEVYFPAGTYRVTAVLQLPTANITLRGVSTIEGGGSKIKTSAASLFKAPAGTYHFFSAYNMTFEGNGSPGVAATTNFIDQTTTPSSSHAYSTIRDCFVLWFKTVHIMSTGSQYDHNNFQNIGQVRLRGGDFMVSNNFFGYDNADATYLPTDGFVEIYAATGVSFAHNYITSWRDPGGCPVPLRVTTASSHVRVFDNWLDGGSAYSLLVDGGSRASTFYGNRIATLNTSSRGIKVSNVRHINISNNLIETLAPGATFIDGESTLVEVIVKDNITNRFDDDTTHDGFDNNSLTQRLLVSGPHLNLTALGAQYNYLTPRLIGRIVTNDGAYDGTQWFYVDPAGWRPGDFIEFTRTKTTNRVIIYTSAGAITHYDSDTAGTNKIRLVCYTQGTLTVENR